VVGDVEGQVLAHYGEANEADVRVFLWHAYAGTISPASCPLSITGAEKKTRRFPQLRRTRNLLVN
jgi:hypothetical protein